MRWSSSPWCSFDAVESGERLRFRHRAVPGEPAAIAVDDLVETSAEQPLTAVTRAAHAELFQAVRIGHMEPEADYRHAMVEARRPLGDAARELTVETGCVMRQETLGARAEILLAESWAARETARLVLPPSWLKLEPGDHVTLAIGGKLKSFRIAETSACCSAASRREAMTQRSMARLPCRSGRPGPIRRRCSGRRQCWCSTCRRLRAPARTPLVAAAAKPWPQALVVLSDPGGGAYHTECVLRRPAVMGTTLDPLGAGPLWRTDPATMIRVRLIAGALQSVPRAALLGGANAAAIGTPEDGFEIVQFAAAELVDPDTYALTGLIRGQGGSEPEMLGLRPAGQRFVLLDGNVVPLKPAADPIAAGHAQGRPAGRDPADPAFVDVTMVSRGLSRAAGAGASPVAPRWRGAALSMDPPHADRRRCLGGCRGAAWRGARAL